MAGVKRRTKYRKNVAQELEEHIELEEGDLIAYVLGSRGGNLFDVESQDGVVALCRLPTRFRKMVWIKRGSYIVVNQAAEDVEITGKGDSGKAKVLFAAKHILMEHQIKELKRAEQWPDKFLTADEREQLSASKEEELVPSEATLNDDATENVNTDDSPKTTSTVRQVSEEEAKARLLEQYMYESETDDEDDLLMVQNRNRQFLDSDDETTDSDES